MKCKECKDTRVYQPLIGPPETCRACCSNSLATDTGINSLWPIATLRVPFGITNMQLGSVMDRIIDKKAVGCNIKVTKDGEVTSGGPTVLALRELKKSKPHTYAKLVPGNMLNVTVCDAQYSEKLGRMVATCDVQCEGRLNRLAVVDGAPWYEKELGTIVENKSDLFATLYGGDPGTTAKALADLTKTIESKQAMVIGSSRKDAAKAIGQEIRKELRRRDLVKMVRSQDREKKQLEAEEDESCAKRVMADRAKEVAVTLQKELNRRDLTKTLQPQDSSMQQIAAEQKRAKHDEPQYLMGTAESRLYAESAAMRQRASSLEACLFGEPPPNLSNVAKQHWQSAKDAVYRLRAAAIVVRLHANAIRREQS